MEAAQSVFLGVASRIYSEQHLAYFFVQNQSFIFVGVSYNLRTKNYFHRVMEKQDMFSPLIDWFDKWMAF